MSLQVCLGQTVGWSRWTHTGPGVLTSICEEHQVCGPDGGLTPGTRSRGAGPEVLRPTCVYRPPDARPPASEQGRCVCPGEPCSQLPAAVGHTPSPVLGLPGAPPGSLVSRCPAATCGISVPPRSPVKLAGGRHSVLTAVRESRCVPSPTLGSQEVGMVVPQATGSVQWDARSPFPFLEAGHFRAWPTSARLFPPDALG